MTTSNSTDDNWDFDFNDNELQKILDDIHKQNDDLNHLCSFHDFSVMCATRIEEMSTRFSVIEEMIETCRVSDELEVDYNFGLGVCWIGAVAVYEGHLHKIFMGTLAVDKLQSQIVDFCRKRIVQKRPPSKNMKEATSEAIKNWFLTRTITDPRTITKNLNEIFKIQIETPPDDFCDHLLKIRNSFTHKGGEHYKISPEEVEDIVNKLSGYAIKYTTSLVDKIKEMLSAIMQPIKDSNQ